MEPSSPPPPSQDSDLFPSTLPLGERDPDEDHSPAEEQLFLNVDDSSEDESPILLDNSTPEPIVEPDVPSVSTSPESSSSSPDEPLCVICFERPPETTLEPCGHANLCLTCLSRLVKRRCPTCRARAKKVRYVDHTGQVVTRTVREVIAERKRAEMDVLASTLQIVFLGPPSVGKKSLVRKLLSKFPLHPDSVLPEDESLFSDGTEFAANARMSGAEVRLSVLRRTSLVSRRMMLDDVRVLKPDVLVLCCSAHTAATFEELQSWDRVLRSAFARSRVWVLLADDNNGGHDLAADAAGFHLRQSVPATISAISPPEVRPRGHYLCTKGPAFNIGFKSLAKNVVEIGRVARDEQFAAALAADEVRNMAAHHAAGTLAEQQHAASLVIANNGIPVPSFSRVTATSSSLMSRAQTAENRPSESSRTPFGIRGLRTSSPREAAAANGTATAGGNRNGAFSLAGVMKWFSGPSAGGTQ